MAKPTKDDADIMLRLAQLSALMNVEEAFNTIWDPSFQTDPAKYPEGTRERTLVYRALRWLETIGTLYRNGLVNEDLLFDWLAVTGVWERLKPFALENRAETIPQMWENAEYMAERQRSWKPSRA